jgi:hypothetical protein
LSGASVERTARTLGVLRPVDTGVAYKVDGASVTAEQARAIPASEIAAMSVARDSSSAPSVVITTKGRVELKRKRPAGDSDLVAIVGSSAVAAHGGGPAQASKVSSDTAIVWFVNGVRIDYLAFRALNRDDIESVDVVKGPAAEQEYNVPPGKAVVSVRLKKGG